jgi:peptidoglycan/LPS O-acetylase OafA/YrhL
LLHQAPRVSTPKGLAVTLFAAALTIVLAEISWVVLEEPLLRRGQAFKYATPLVSTPQAAIAPAE